MLSNFTKSIHFIIVTLIISFFGIYTGNAQSKGPYVKFTEEPAKILNKKNNQFTNYNIKFKTRRTSTIYLELVDPDNIVVANSVLELKGRKLGEKKLTMQVFKGVKLKSNSHYKYRLTMFEAPVNTWTGKLPEFIVNDIKVTKL